MSDKEDISDNKERRREKRKEGERKKRTEEGRSNRDRKSRSQSTLSAPHYDDKHNDRVVCLVSQAVKGKEMTLRRM
jgi:hypothetical protein